MNIPTQNPEEVQVLILDAARKRFLQFGYNKTTMAEIAEDCQMSAANLYRYFKNKQEIGAQLASQCLDITIDKLGDLLADKNANAANLLHGFVMVILRDNYDRFSASPRIDELVQMIMTERRDVLQRHSDATKELLAKMLEDAHRSGEFVVTSPSKTAEAIISAIKMFSTPIFMHAYPLEILERNAADVIHLLLQGLLKR